MIYKKLTELQNAVAVLGEVQLDRWSLLDLCGVQGAMPGPGPKFTDSLFDEQGNAALGIVLARALAPRGLQTQLGSRIFVRVSAIK